MVQVVHLNQEQLALVDRLKAEEQKFIANPALIGSEAAIAAARALIDRAIADKLPEVAFVGIRTMVSLHDTDLSLPEHLRTFKPLS